MKLSENFVMLFHLTKLCQI